MRGGQAERREGCNSACRAVVPFFPAYVEEVVGGRGGDGKGGGGLMVELERGVYVRAVLPGMEGSVVFSCDI